MHERNGMKVDDLLDTVGRAIVDLSVHPVGCDDWRFYEQLCLDVAEDLDVAYQAFKASNAPADCPRSDAVEPVVGDDDCDCRTCENEDGVACALGHGVCAPPRKGCIDWLRAKQ